MIRTQCFHCHGLGSIPGPGTKRKGGRKTREKRKKKGRKTRNGERERAGKKEEKKEGKHHQCHVQELADIGYVHFPSHWLKT